MTLDDRLNRSRLDLGAATGPCPETNPLPTGGQCLYAIAGTTAVAGGPDSSFEYYSLAPSLLAAHSLRVSTSGSGSGEVTGPGVECGPGRRQCIQTYTSGTSITLTAKPALGSTFAGWSGACSGRGVCRVTMNADQVVGAAFTAPRVTTSLRFGRHRGPLSSPIVAPREADGLDMVITYNSGPHCPYASADPHFHVTWLGRALALGNASAPCRNKPSWYSNQLTLMWNTTTGAIIRARWEVNGKAVQTPSGLHPSEVGALMDICPDRSVAFCNGPKSNSIAELQWTRGTQPIGRALVPKGAKRVLVHSNSG